MLDRLALMPAIATRGFAAALTLALVLVGGESRAESVVRPGTTLGLSTASPDPVGLYYIHLSSVGVRATRPSASVNNANVPAFLWSTPWSLADARLEFIAALPFVAEREAGAAYQSGFGQGFLAGRLSWDLGADVGVSYLLGGYLPGETEFLTTSASLSHRFAASYTGDGWNLTAHLLYGHILGPGSTTDSVAPDYLNLDLTVAREFGAWEVGIVAFASTDLPTRVAGYRPDSQVAAGGLVGYDFGPVSVQAYLTRDLVQRNYGGSETRAWLRFVVPITADPEKPGPARPLSTPQRSN